MYFAKDVKFFEFLVFLTFFYKNQFWFSLSYINLKEYAQKNKTFTQNVLRTIGPNYISLERASQEKKKIP